MFCSLTTEQRRLYLHRCMWKAPRCARHIASLCCLRCQQQPVPWASADRLHTEVLLAVCFVAKACCLLVPWAVYSSTLGQNGVRGATCGLDWVVWQLPAGGCSSFPQRCEAVVCQVSPLSSERQYISESQCSWPLMLGCSCLLLCHTRELGGCHSC